MMSLHLALPREGHIKQIFHIFEYIKKHNSAELVFDPIYPLIEEENFEQIDWTTIKFGHVHGK